MVLHLLSQAASAVSSSHAFLCQMRSRLCHSLCQTVHEVSLCMKSQTVWADRLPSLLDHYDSSFMGDTMLQPPPPLHNCFIEIRMTQVKLGTWGMWWPLVGCLPLHWTFVEGPNWWTWIEMMRRRRWARLVGY
jgi:hypothetical protein